MGPGLFQSMCSLWGTVNVTLIKCHFTISLYLQLSWALFSLQATGGYGSSPAHNDPTQILASDWLTACTHCSVFPIHRWLPVELPSISEYLPKCAMLTNIGHHFNFQSLNAQMNLLETSYPHSYAALSALQGYPHYAGHLPGVTGPPPDQIAALDCSINQGYYSTGPVKFSVDRILTTGEPRSRSSSPVVDKDDLGKHDSPHSRGK